MHSVKFSILVPAFKTVFLEDCLKSILSQTCQDFEVIIVDDASPEDIKSVVDRFDDSKIKYSRNSTGFGAREVVRNWNRCLELADGEYVICLGDDDELCPDCLEIYSRLIERYPDLDVYHIRTRIIDDHGEVIGSQETRPEFESVYSAMWGRWHGRIQFIGDYLFRTSRLRHVGGFYYIPYAWGADDITSYVVAGQKGIANAQEFGFRYRESRHTISRDRELALEKINSARLCGEWYKSFLSMPPSDPANDPTWKSLCSELDSFMHTFYLRHVREDIKRHPFKGCVYWLKHRKYYGIPFYKFASTAVRALTHRK